MNLSNALAAIVALSRGTLALALALAGARLAGMMGAVLIAGAPLTVGAVLAIGTCASGALVYAFAYSRALPIA